MNEQGVLFAPVQHGGVYLGERARMAQPEPLPADGRGRNVHSLVAHLRHAPEFSRRARLILDDLRQHGPATAREIKERMGFSDMNAVRPRLTEMVKAVPPLVVEQGSKQDAATGVPVTVYAAAEL